MGKNKMIAISNSWRIGCQGFWVKYYPERSGGWRFYPKPGGLDLYSRECGLWQAKIIFAIVFYFFIALPLFFIFYISSFSLSMISYMKIYLFKTYLYFSYFYIFRGEHVVGGG